MQKHWLHAVPWENVITVNKALCQAQKLNPTTNARTFDAVRQLWENAAARSLSLKEVFDVCRECQDKLPFTFNNGNTFAAVGRTLIEEGTKKLPPVEAQIVQTTVCHYIAGLIGRRELLQVLKHFEASWRPEPAATEAPRLEKPVAKPVVRAAAAPMLVEAPRA
jgi:hypothetical protein